MIETVWPDGVPVDAACAWARVHGLDPDRIPVTAPIVLDYGRRRITYTVLVEDVDGKARWLDGRLVTERVTVQLESPPRPFPEALGDHD